MIAVAQEPRAGQRRSTTVTVWDSIKKILRSEGADLKDGLDGARDKLDGFLTEKEQERAASPKERMDMIEDDMAATESEFDRIIDKAEGRTHEQTAESELRDALGSKPKPATTAPAAPEAAASPTEIKAADTAASADADVDPADTERAAAEQAAAEKAAAEKAAAEKRAAEEAAKRQAARQAADAKFEEQKAKAGDLLDELRGELGIDDGGRG